MTNDITFRTTTPNTAGRVLAAVANDIFPAWLSGRNILVQEAQLPFYEQFRLYALIDTAAAGPNIRHVLYKPGWAILMDWTNEPIYRVNELAPIRLDRTTVIPYAKFFFHYVRGQLGRFIIVESPDDMVWLPNVTEKEKADVAATLRPATYRGLDADQRFTVTCTVVFKNALFRTDIKVASREMDLLDANLGTLEHFTIGQMELTNEELLLEDLSVPVDPPPLLKDTSRAVRRPAQWLASVNNLAMLN
jgi:hypothetical protein